MLAHEIRARVARGEVSPLEVAQAYRKRVQELDPGLGEAINSEMVGEWEEILERERLGANGSKEIQTVRLERLDGRLEVRPLLLERGQKLLQHGGLLLVRLYGRDHA